MEPNYFSMSSTGQTWCANNCQLSGLKALLFFLKEKLSCCILFLTMILIIFSFSFCKKFTYLFIQIIKLYWILGSMKIVDFNLMQHR